MSLGDLAYLSEALRDVFGELCKVGSLQNAEIAKLGGRSWDEVPELQSQAASLLRRLDDVARQAELSAFFGEDHESDSGASSSFDEPKAATIQKWSHYVGEFREGQEFPVGLSDYDSDEDADSVGVDDSASMVGVNNYDDQPVEDHEADISLRSVNASFWKSSGFNWADEASLFDEEFDDERGDEPQYSSSNLVPELDEDSGHLDTTSESGLSFRSEEMNGRSSVIGSSHDGDAQEKRDVVAVEPVVVTDANRQFFRDRTVSFNYKLMAEYDADTDTEKESSPRKPSPSTFPRRLLHSNLPHLRRTRIDSLPNMGRLVALQE